MNRNLRRGVVAVAAAVFVSLALLANPASAATINFDVTAGTVTLINSTGTATDTIQVGPGVTTLGTDCVNLSTIATTETTTSVTHWQISGWAVVVRVKLNTTWYILEETRTGGAAGTVTAVTTTSATLNSSTVGMAMNFYTATDQTETGTSCAHGTTRTCRFANVNLTLQGTYSGDIHNPAASDTASLSGTGTLGIATPPCVAPFTTYNGGTIALSGLVLHIL